MSENFPVRDITHKPRRMQADNLADSNKGEQSVDCPDDNNSFGNVTIERAIKFYQENVQDPVLGNLYLMTSKWLESLLNRSLPKTPEVPGGNTNE